MFGRSKSKASATEESAAGKQAGSGPAAPAVAPAAPGAKPATRSGTGPSNGTETPQDQASRRRAGIAIRHSLAFAQIVGVLMRSRQHSRYPIAALRWLVLPPLLSGQYSIGHSQSAPNRAGGPVAVALWARVSPEVDRKLTETLDKPVQLRAGEWRSGDILWLVEAIGSQRALPPFLKHLSETVFKGWEVKVRFRGADGTVSVQTLQALTAA
ncbi:MAG TPA: toxin-activating lysine-acyltransferase [Stellaceae bacterium]|nr:toxin-activating lysine-acyltransferase [Stellaceae bacterium]